MKEIEKAHIEIEQKIFLMLPEKWEKLCLYASVIEFPNDIQTGEMFFYYFPKGLLKKRPINSYEVPSKFGIDENQYLRFAKDLYASIKKLRRVCIQNREKPWNSVTIIIENLSYKAIYNYEESDLGKFESKSMDAVWRYKYLGEAYESFSRKEREMIDKSKETEEKIQVFEMSLYTKEINSNLESIKNIEKRMEFVTDNKIAEMEFIKSHVPKSQILNSK